MIDGPGELHWCTLYDEDDEPYGETCRCSVGEDHEESETGVNYGSSWVAS